MMSLGDDRKELERLIARRVEEDVRDTLEDALDYLQMHVAPQTYREVVTVWANRPERELK